jgi:hypothetical protein
MNMAKPPDNERLEREVVALMKHEEMQEAADYLRRGRRFEKIDTATVQSRWTVAFRNAFRKMHEAPTQELQNEFNDLSAELALRGAERPFDSVQSEIARIQAEIAREGHSETLKRIDAKFSAFRKAREKPSG